MGNDRLQRLMIMNCNKETQENIREMVKIWAMVKNGRMTLLQISNIIK